MTGSMLIEEERGAYARSGHPHNGYYAGDFRVVSPRESSPGSSQVRPSTTELR